MDNNSEQVTASLKQEGADEKQKTVGGNYPWDYKSDLEKETEKIMEPAASPAVSTAISEVLSKIEKGPIYLEDEKPHPYFRPTLKTLYAKRGNQVVIEAQVIIPHHLIDSISEQVQKGLKEKKHSFETPVNVIFEESDNAGVLNVIKTGVVKEYRFRDISPNSGSISATLEGVIEWNQD